MHNYVPSHRYGLTSRYFDVEKLAKLAKTAIYIHIISMTLCFLFACFYYSTETKKLLQKNHNISSVPFRVLIHFYGQTELFFKYLSICGPRKQITPNGRIISQHPACFECLASGEIQNINIFNQI